MTTQIDPSCPTCGGKMWDNRDTKKNPKAPDYKCRDRTCDGVVWPPKPGTAPAPTLAAPVQTKQAVSIGGPLPYELEETGAAPKDTTVPLKFALAFGAYDQCLAHAVRAAATYPTANLDIAAMAATLFINVSR